MAEETRETNIPRVRFDEVNNKLAEANAEIAKLTEQIATLTEGAGNVETLTAELEALKVSSAADLAMAMAGIVDPKTMNYLRYEHSTSEDAGTFDEYLNGLKANPPSYLKDILADKPVKPAEKPVEKPKETPTKPDETPAEKPVEKPKLPGNEGAITENGKPTAIDSTITLKQFKELEKAGAFKNLSF